MAEESAYFLTVDWCGKGRRGVFCNSQPSSTAGPRWGMPYRKKDGSQHTKEEMHEILGVFFLILDPESTLFTESELAEFNRWTPLDEYSGEYGIARKATEGEEE